MSVYILATLDTKGHEAALVRDLLSQAGVRGLLVDTGCLGVPQVAVDVPREVVYQTAGTTWQAVRELADRGHAVSAAARGATLLIGRWHAQGLLSGVIGLGGSAGTTIGTRAMRELPLGVPKLMVSTLASGQVRHYVGDKDILMLNTVVDLAGINRISRGVLTLAAHAMAGMVKFAEAPRDAVDKPIVCASMFGVTTPCVEQARQVLEQAGYEVLVFHATGNGGQAMESLIDEGLVAGVLDITTTELADELVGGVLSAGPGRLTAAARRGVPQVVSVGATDMVNFHAPETVPACFASRTFHQHNANVTLMRTTVEENRLLGKQIGHKVKAARGPTCVMLPAQGVSAIDRRGQPFDDPPARRALFEALKQAAGATEVQELDRHINDPEFAIACAGRLLELMRTASSTKPTTRTSTS